MKYRVHQLEMKKENAQEQLEHFVNGLQGEILSIIPWIVPAFQGMGATAKVGFVLIVEKYKNNNFVWVYNSPPHKLVGTNGNFLATRLASKKCRFQNL